MRRGVCVCLQNLWLLIARPCQIGNNFGCEGFPYFGGGHRDGKFVLAWVLSLQFVAVQLFDWWRRWWGTIVLHFFPCHFTFSYNGCLTLFPRGCQFPGGGVSDTPLGNQGRSCFRPHVPKSYFETYKSYDHMQNFRPYLKNSARYRDLKNLS